MNVSAIYIHVAHLTLCKYLVIKVISGLDFNTVVEETIHVEKDCGPNRHSSYRGNNPYREIHYELLTTDQTDRVVVEETIHVGKGTM